MVVLLLLAVVFVCDVITLGLAFFFCWLSFFVCCCACLLLFCESSSVPSVICFETVLVEKAGQQHNVL